MTGDELGILLRDCPTLYHLAEPGSWPSIRRHGLLSTTALLDLYGVTGNPRQAIETERRPDGVRLDTPGLEGVLIRDQKPMTDAGLARCLTDGLLPTDWYRILNARVFFWLDRRRLDRRRKARPYRALAHDVIELDAARLVAAHAGTIELSPINSGTTARYPARRGSDTFLPIADYPYAHWRRRRGRHDRVVELTVPGGVPRAAGFVRRIVRTGGERDGDILFESRFADGGALV